MSSSNTDNDIPEWAIATYGSTTIIVSFIMLLEYVYANNLYILQMQYWTFVI